MTSAEKDPDAWLALQALLLDHGAVILINDDDIEEITWEDIEARLTQ